MASRSEMSSTFFAISSAGSFTFWAGWYSSVFQSSAKTLIAVGTLLLLVEAALGLVAQPLAVEHLQEERRQRQVAALVLDVGGGVAHDVSKNVETHEIAEAEGAGLRPAHGGSGKGVDFFDAEVHLLHDAHDVQHGEGANAVGDEVRRVLGMDDAFAEVQIAEVSDGLHQRRDRRREWESIPAGACSAAD